MAPKRPKEPDGSRRGFVHEGAYEIIMRRKPPGDMQNAQRPLEPLFRVRTRQRVGMGQDVGPADQPERPKSPKS